jgi:small subunit ribosomal protein S17
MPRRILVGVVTSDKASKTRRVEIGRLVRHARYTKIIRKTTVCHAHDENNESHLGDLVEIEESRPISKLKRWKLIRVVEKNKGTAANVSEDLASEVTSS